MVDCIVVGNGLAGTILAHSLLLKGKRVILYAHPTNQPVSKIAAGIYNPMVFKRLTKSWWIDTLLPYAENYYLQAEQAWGKSFWHPKTLTKLFASQQEAAQWHDKVLDGRFNQYLETQALLEADFKSVLAPNGAGIVKHAGHLDIEAFLNGFEQQYASCIKREVFKYDDLHLTDSGIQYQDLQAKHVVFCEGESGRSNPWFGYLPFQVAKGQVLTGRFEQDLSSDIPLNRIVNKGVFVLPLGDGLYKVGATYEWNPTDSKATQEAREELLAKLFAIIPIHFNVLKQDAGIRPTVLDRRPFLGKHPQAPQLAIFNGLGTKGVMLAPYLANHLIEHLFADTALNNEVDIKRVK